MAFEQRPRSSTLMLLERAVPPHQVWTRKNERPLGATLAPISRSEKPQLLSRHAACFGRRRPFNPGIRGFFPFRCCVRAVTRCRTFPFEFICLLWRRKNADTIDDSDRWPGRELHTRAGATLLNFTSGLHSGFRFGLSRHKFATGVSRRRPPQWLSLMSAGDGHRLTRAATRATDRLPKR